MSDTMAMLAENYKLGIGITSGVLILAYILVSIFALLKYKKVRGGISYRGMLPLVNIFMLFVKEKKAEVPEEVIIDDIF